MQKNMKNYILVAALVIWMCIIFAFSAQPAEESTDISMGVGMRISKIFVPGFEEWETIEQIEFAEGIDFAVRKTAHFLEYMMLGILWMLSLLTKPDSRFSLKKSAWISAAASALYAAGDEFHQLFVEGRAGRWQDVCIDTAGAVTGILVVLMIIRLYRRGMRR